MYGMASVRSKETWSPFKLRRTQRIIRLNGRNRHRIEPGTFPYLDPSLTPSLRRCFDQLLLRLLSPSPSNPIAILRQPPGRLVDNLKAAWLSWPRLPLRYLGQQSRLNLKPLPRPLADNLRKPPECP